MDKVDLYAQFGVPRDANASTIKKAYHRLCLKYHPDKLSNLSTDADRASASAEFQKITHFHAILSDPDRRKRYDSTGFVGTVGGSDSDNGIDIQTPPEGWDAFFRTLWGSLTTDKIDSFMLQYRGSNEEKQDLIKNYEKYSGNMAKILDATLFAIPDDEQRFRTIVQAALDAGQVTVKHAAFFTIDERATARRKRRAEKEAQEAEKIAAVKKKKEDAQKKKEAKNEQADDAEDDWVDDDGGQDIAEDADKMDVDAGDGDSRTSKNGSKKGVPSNQTLKGKKGAKGKKAAATDDGSDGDEGLASLRDELQKRHQERMGSVISKFEERATKESLKKGAAGPKKGSKSKNVEPSEEEFQALQGKLFANASKIKSSKGAPVAAAREESGSPEVDELEEDVRDTRKSKRARKA
ncbi:DnaJ sub C member 9 [Chytriomyces hyalinus]|nr:DnaJ sub C member 9 [Chytriomyces hyalinus]